MDPNQQAAPPPTNSNEANAKRQALTGQWRTPPLPVFAGQQQGRQQQEQQAPPQGQQQQQPVQMHDASALPQSTDDYAKALQEAYRAGAEAAAALQMQQQQQQQQVDPSPEFSSSMSNAVSCPNFQQLQPPHPGAVPAVAPQISEVEPMPEHSSAAAAAAVLVPNPLMSVPAAAAAPQQLTHPMHQPPPQASVPPRSFSLPDMASYAARAQAEEEKRKKRLARNRASARLRRLRKKNLVDSYEGEVGVLEQSLQKLRAHEWGEAKPEDDPTSALLEALGMERGQQVLEDSAQRSALLKDLWQQQQDQVQYVRDCQLEQQVLQALVCGESDDTGLLQELQGVLQLTPDQCDSLNRATQGLDEDVQAMETVEACLKAMQEQDWLLQNEGVTQITNQFTTILNPNQVSKFLLWTDANSESMEQLDYIHAATDPVPNSPIFSFGIDDYYPGGSHTGSSGSLAAMMQTGEDD